MEHVETHFAPAGRLTDAAILEQAERIRQQENMPALFNLIPNLLLVINQERQIIFSNQALMDMLGLSSPSDQLGLRVGEMLGCVYSSEMPGGCGTTEHCRVCGAVLAMLEAQRTRAAVSRECLLTARGDGRTKSMELMVHAMPAGVEGENFTLLMVRDISEDKRRKAMEQIFFHDMLNTSGAIKSMLELQQKSTSLEDTRELGGYALEAAEMIMEEILSQRDMIAAENRELKVRPVRFSALDMLDHLLVVVRNQAFHPPDIRLDCEEMPELTGDVVLIRRVVNNMLKNALEASPDAPVFMGVRRREAYAEFWVRNEQVMSREVQLQVFKRAFSSKGASRGYGTYGMKLLGEGALGGYVRFTSEPENGTVFVFGVPYSMQGKDGKGAE